jgi:hypothetical protein
MKKLLLLLTVIALCGCEKQKETEITLTGGTWVLDEGFGGSVRTMHFSESTVEYYYMALGQNPITGNYDTAWVTNISEYKVTEANDTLLHFCFEYFNDVARWHGNLYHNGEHKNKIILQWYEPRFDTFGGFFPFTKKN